MIKLGILEFGYALNKINSTKVIEETVLNSVKIEELGFSRLWIGEHYNEYSTWSSPEVILSLIVSKTKAIKVGAAGVLLNYHNPYRMIQTFKMLSTLFPNRIELGFARGGVPDFVKDYIHKLAASDSMDFFINQINQVFKIIENDQKFLNGNDTGGYIAPVGGAYPDYWFLGTSDAVFEQAVTHKSNFSLSLFHDTSYQKDNKDLLRIFSEKFYSTNGFLPLKNIAIKCICLEDKKDLEGWKSKNNYIYKEGFIIGNKSECKSRLLELQKKYDTEEIIVSIPFLSGEDNIDVKFETLYNISDLQL
ncbi:LLM class flavin-dependent oxidoreductase [Sphingobacterium anhuiense]|uniref:LLM class flavin-dependent oxidoreductase n=1 Tax=Sphingobacterium anhuiense TaxID=493780 RepID=A0ABW5YQD9_9SPHI